MSDTTLAIEKAAEPERQSNLIERHLENLTITATRAEGLPGLSISMSGAADGFLTLADASDIDAVVNAISQIRAEVQA